MMNVFFGIAMLFFNTLQPVFQGNLKLNLDYLLYPDTGKKYSLELFYEIPYSSLSFVKNTTGFIADYRLTLELFDQKKNIIDAEVFEHRVEVSDYILTISRDSFLSDVIRLKIPRNAVMARVTCSDLKSDRRAFSQFPLWKQSDPIILRLLKSGQPNPNRTYGLNDTIEIIAEINADHPSDIIQLVITKNCRNIIQEKIGLSGKDSLKWVRFLFPVLDSFNQTQISTGVYVAKVFLPPDEGIKGSVEFIVDLPFWFDDSTWLAKVDQLQYIATYEEMKKLKKIAKDLRKQAWDEFWYSKDPNPSTEINEKEEEYFQRIHYCEEHYARGDRGYKSDRARIYITYGPPDQIEHRPFEIDLPAEEIWYYYQPNLTFIFIDRFGSGQFVLWTEGR